jgi:hypothetical protein
VPLLGPPARRPRCASISQPRCYPSGAFRVSPEFFLFNFWWCA